MSYDPSEEEFELLISDILNAFEVCPNRTKKLLFLSLFERISALKILLEEKGVLTDDEKIYLAMTTKFDKIEVLRLNEARRFLGELMKKELP